MALPTTAIYVARVQLGLAGLAIVAAIVGGLAMQIELWSPGAKWSSGFYSDMLGLHGLVSIALGSAVFGGGFGYALIGRIAGTRLPAPAIAWAGVGLWVIGLIAMLVTFVSSARDAGWTLYTPYSDDGPSRPLSVVIAPLAFGAAGLVYALHLATMLAANRAPVVRSAIAGAFVLAVGVAGAGYMREAFAAIPQVGVDRTTMALALILATAALAGDGAGTRGIVAAIAIACGVGWVLIASALPALPFAIAVAGLWIALAIMGGFSRTQVAFVVFGVAPAMLIYNLARLVATPVGDEFLHDTQFIVGAIHAVGAMLAFAALAGGHAWPAWRVPQPVLAWIGAVVASVGMLLQIIASMRIGGAGMPRRYWDYDPSFVVGQWSVMLASLFALVGVLLVILAWALGKPSDR